jgi:hypothetical protein
VPFHIGQLSVQGMRQEGSVGDAYCQGTVWSHVTSHLLIFQQDQAHDGDVDGIPNAGVMKQASHLCERQRTRL